MNDLEVGDRIKDNDPRMNGRTLKVIGLDVRYVYCERVNGGPQYRILRNRVFTDGKARRTGFSKVTGAATDVGALQK